MAPRKTRRKQQGRRPAGPAAAAPPAPGVAPRAAPGVAAPAAAGQARPVQLNLSAQRNPRRRPGMVVIEDADPGIPLSRVPYFLSDLRKLGLAVALMLLLLVAGSRLIPLVIK
ncbi:MAG: hypothetical protein JF888_10550 [Candidatus Dormibacteraeota bacterium]|uniref:Uncharacterized protein n=1 Tax=Candidatus Dormiibacter inghamiae TaxID=3127013 RepID=A0A934KIU5_9BACT|nr:hypothetical protein [Candidatus Dormibacteraeota bacterium]MBJ7607365.1 hypothetical protein [Candidatus Dormibacteraeota bacterium]